MKQRGAVGWRVGRASALCSLALGVLAVAPAAVSAQDSPAPGTRGGAWRYIGGDAWHTRYTPADQINARNFNELKLAWQFDGTTLGAETGRSTPVYAGGKLFTVTGPRRHVVAMDPATGEVLWTYREPHTTRWSHSMRADYGKGIAYTEIDGRGVVFITTPAFFLTALDAETGKPLENWGSQVPAKGFPKSGVVDLLKDLVSDWGPWIDAGRPFDADAGVPLELGYITSSSPPIVVNDVIVVGNSAEQGYNQARAENIPGDILGYDVKTGKFLWKFHIIPRPGEVGHETWENDAWRYVGDVSSWAPMSADPELGMVYFAVNSATVDFYGGFRPGDNLFSSSILALDVKTGQRKWHFQMVHHDIWNYDPSTAPILLDVDHNGRRVPAIVQVTKQGLAYAFNRQTGEPLWPIVERPVRTEPRIPGEQLSPTQPFPTKPAPYDIQGLSDDELIDFTPELKAEALRIVAPYQYGGMYTPPIHRDNNLGKIASIWCPGEAGGVNIDGPAAADPTTGILYVTSRKACGSRIMVPGPERDAMVAHPTGKRIVDYAVGTGGRVPQGPQGLPLLKPPYSRITAIDMNTGEHLWWIPVGDTPDRIKNHPALRGVDVGKTGTGMVASQVVSSTLLMYTGEASDGTPMLFAVDKRTGQEVGRVQLPARASYGAMSYVHDGRQYVVAQVPRGFAVLNIGGYKPAVGAAH